MIHQLIYVSEESVYVMLCCMICVSYAGFFAIFSKYLLTVCIDYQIKWWAD